MKLVKDIIKKLEKGESAILLCPPLISKSGLIKALLKEAKTLKKKVEITDLRNLNNLSVESFLKLLPKNLESKILIIVDCDLLFPLGATPFLKLLLIHEKHQTNFLFISSQNILTERLRARLCKIPILFENIFYLPLDAESLPFKNKVMAENFLACLEESQRETLRLLVRNLPIENPNWLSEVEYLKNIGLVKKTRGGFKTISPLINKAALGLPEIAIEGLHLKGEKIFVQKNNITSSFSPSQQKILRLLLKKKGEIINREKIAKSLWDKDYLERYSDWAIDQMIFKLKRKLEKLWLDPALVKTTKGKGFYIKARVK